PITSLFLEPWARGRRLDPSSRKEPRAEHAELAPFPRQPRSSYRTGRRPQVYRANQGFTRADLGSFPDFRVIPRTSRLRPDGDATAPRTQRLECRVAHVGRPGVAAHGLVSGTAGWHGRDAAGDGDGHARDPAGAGAAELQG